MLQKVGQQVFCRDCPDYDNCNHDGRYIFQGSSNLLAFWNKKESPYSGNWMNQPIGFSKFMNICDEEYNNFQKAEAEKRKNRR